MKVYIADALPEAAWATRNAWPCSVVEGELVHEGRTHRITRQPLTGPRWAIGLPDSLPARVLLDHGPKNIDTVKKNNPTVKPRLLAGGLVPDSLEETATEFVVALKKGTDGKVTETKESKPAPVAIVPTEPTEATPKGK